MAEQSEEISSNHIILRLITGDEIICKLKVASPNGMIVDDPVALYVAMDEENSMMYFNRFSAFTKDTEFTFNRNLIIAEYKPSPPLIQKYDAMLERYKAKKIELTDEQKASIYTAVLENSNVEQGLKN